MKKRLTRLAAAVAGVAIGLGTGFAAYGIAKNGAAADVLAAGNSEVWATYATEKIMRDVSDGYKSVKFAPEIDVYAAKGEYEGSQIILSPDKNIGSVTFETQELKSGNDTFEKANIEVFYEKYVHVTKVYDVAGGAKAGWYPDALVPMDAIVKAGENTVKKGENQGIYVRFNVGLDQPAGVYEGKFTLKYDGTKKEIPVRLEVKDFTISEESHSRSLFIHEWQYRLGELDSTQAMLEKYIEAGLEYRICPSTVVLERSFDDEGVAYFVEKAVRFMKNPKCTHVSLPFDGKVVDGQNAFNTESMKKILRKFVEASVRDNTDYIAKLGCHLVDEPQLNNTFEKTKVMTRLFRETKKAIAEEIAADTSIEKTLREKLAYSAEHIVGAVTGKYEEKYAEHVDVWCPQVDYCDTEAERAVYAEDYERWWYTCISPRAPYPTYHTEDTLLSARSMGWMQAEYDVKGVLFWATDVYAEYDGSKYVNIEDFYEGNASRFPQVNGDGYLFYPGKKYGIDGPIGSLRLEAIRDGLEEYEILYALKEKYAEDGSDVSSLIKMMRSDLYSDTTVSATNASFASARKMLYSIPLITNSDADVRITDVKQTDFNKYGATITTADNGYDLYSGGKKVTNYATENGRRIYTVETTLSESVNNLDVRVEKDGKSYSFVLPLGGKVSVYGADKLLSGFAKVNAEVKGEVVDGATVGADSSLLKLAVGEVFEYSQSIKFTADFLTSIADSPKRVVVRFFMTGLTEELPVSVAVYTENKTTGTEIGSATLKNGYNEIELNLSGMGSENGRKIKYLVFTFGEVGPEEGRLTPARTVYFKDFIIYDK